MIDEIQGQVVYAHLFAVAMDVLYQAHPHVRPIYLCGSPGAAPLASGWKDIDALRVVEHQNVLLESEDDKLNSHVIKLILVLLALALHW